MINTQTNALFRSLSTGFRSGRWLAVALALIGGALHARAEEADVPVELRAPAGCAMLFPEFTDRGLWVARPWPNGIVPYAFNPNVSLSNRADMRLAMDVLESVCNVVFIPRTVEGNYLFIQDNMMNNSYVGMIGNAQTVNIYNWNYTFIMCHELMHALGVFHEQSRPDRDTYVTINEANIQPDALHNFDPIFGTSMHGEYDFDSVMHYGQCDFTKCCANSCNCSPACRTIVANPGYTQHQNTMGQVDHLSDGDIAGLQLWYGPVGSEPAKALPLASWPFPNNLITIPSPASPDLSTIFGQEASFGFMMTTRTGYHALDAEPLQDTLPASEQVAEYTRFFNAVMSTPGAVNHIAVADPLTLDSGGGTLPGTQWLPSATPKRITVIKLPPAPPAKGN